MILSLFDTITNGLKEIGTGIGGVSDRVESTTGKINDVDNRIGTTQIEFRTMREVFDSNDKIYRSVRETGEIQN